MLAHGHAPGGCEGSVVMEASFHSRTLFFCPSSIPQFHPLEQVLVRGLSVLGLLQGRTLAVSARRRPRHTSRQMQAESPLATPSSDVGDATCA